MPPRRNPQRQTSGSVDPNTLAAMNEALASMLPTIVAQTVEAIRQAPNGGTNTGSGPGAQPGDIHVWYERFQKHKPQSFSSAPTPIDAENWIAHLDKIFDVLDCGDNNKVRLATYKLEGDAARWWKASKNAKGGDDFVNALSWDEFQELFYEQYFSHADKEAYEREYANIRQHDDESTNEFMARFMRLVGFLGVDAGTPIQQAKKFKWALKYKIREKLVNFEYADVAQVANAAKNIEMEKLDFQASRGEYNRKRNRDQSTQSGQRWGNNGNQWQQNKQQNLGTGQNQKHVTQKDQNSQGKNHPEREATWEVEDVIRSEYPNLF